MRADLHLHSTASDGMLSPAALMEVCAQAGMDLVALTDHDTLEGLPEARAAAKDHGVELLSGIELSVGLGDHEIHLLGYGLSQDAPSLKGHLEQAKEERRERAQEILEKLRHLGFVIEYQEVAALAGGLISRSHIAHLMREKGMVESIHEAFARYLGPRCPAFIPRPYLPMDRALAMLRDAGGAPVWAHPGRLGWTEPALGRRIEEYAEMGLLGIEVYHPSHTESQMRYLRQTAQRLGLLITGGSDFHGKEVRPVEVGQMLGVWPDVARDIQALRQTVLRAARHADPEPGPIKEE